MLSLPLPEWAQHEAVCIGFPSDPDLWRQIFLANQGHTLKALADFETVLLRLRAAVERADATLLSALLAEGKRRRDAVGS